MIKGLDAFAGALNRVYDWSGRLDFTPCELASFESILEGFEDGLVMMPGMEDLVSDFSRYIWRPEPRVIARRVLGSGEGRPLAMWCESCEELHMGGVECPWRWVQLGHLESGVQLFREPPPGWVIPKGEPLEALAPELCQTLRDACFQCGAEKAKTPDGAAWVYSCGCIQKGM